jgi:hypothetical protein
MDPYLNVVQMGSVPRPSRKKESSRMSLQSILSFERFADGASGLFVAASLVIAAAALLGF